MEIREGSRRTVLLIGPLAIKFATTIGGLNENFFEFLFCILSWRSFVVPTYFSLWILNIQKRVADCELRPDIILDRLKEVANDNRWTTDHHFSNHDSFGSVNGWLVIRDYGSRETQKLIDRHLNQLSVISAT